MRVTRFLAAAALGLMSTLALAGNADQNIRKTLQALQPDLPIDSIASSPLQGLYQVQLKGGRVLYASADGQFVMQGYLYQVKDGKPVNLTEKAESPPARWWCIRPRARPRRTSRCSPIPPARTARSCMPRCRT